MGKYFVIDFKKYGGGEAYKNIMGHNLRKRNYRNRANIDPARSAGNIVLADTDETWSEYMEACNTKARENGGRKLRKGSADFFSIVIDASVIEGWSNDDYIRYLKDAEAWLRERFAGQKILASVIHVDEKKPHLHFTASYFNEERGRWSQKWLAQSKKTDLNALLDDFEKEIGSKYGLRRGLSEKDRAMKKIQEIVEVEKEEPSFFRKLMGQKPKYVFKRIPAKKLARLGRELAIARNAVKEQAVHQMVYRLEEENRRKEEELHQRERELSEKEKELAEAKEKAAEYAYDLLQLKAENGKLRTELAEYERMAKKVGGKEKLAELAKEHETKPKRDNSHRHSEPSFQR